MPRKQFSVRSPGRPKTDAKLVSKAFEEAMESLLGHGLRAEYEAIRKAFTWQAKAFEESAETNKQVINELNRQLKEKEGS